MRTKELAFILILVGVGLVYFGSHQTGSGQQVFERQQQYKVQKIEQGQVIEKCDGALIRFLGQTEPIAEGATEKVLDSGAVGHFPGTGPVGVGNYSLTGHVVTHGEPFRYMPNLSPGDKVRVTKCGTAYTFVVDRRFTVYYTDTSVLDAHPKMLTLITCASRFVHTDYRTIVRGHLVDMHQVWQDTPRQVHRSS